MALQLHTVETAPFEWVWEENPDVRMMLRPASPEINRKVSKASGISVGMDGQTPVHKNVEHILTKFWAVIESWEGIEHDGEAIPATEANAQWLADQEPEIVMPVVNAAEAKYAELLDLAGKSQTQPSGIHTEESTASDSRVIGTLPKQRAASGGDAA